MMEAAAETVRQLSRTILPERPHHLAQSPDWRSRCHPDDTSRRYEEWHDSRLQYMTFLTEADRGTLFTRGYYDIRQEPPRPVSKDVNALARGAPPKKTLSLSDYKNKKTATPASASPPPHNSTPAHTHTPSKPADRASATPAPEPRPEPRQPAPMDSSRKADAAKPSRPDAAPPARPKAPVGDHAVADMRCVPRSPRSPTGCPSTEALTHRRLPPKPPPKVSLPAKPPTPESRKRIADTDDGSRPPKRPKPMDTARPADDHDRYRDDPSRDPSRRKTHDPATARDSLPNGRSRLSAATGSSRATSPAARSRGNSVNGVKHGSHDSNHSTPGKPDPHKPYLPPLLSPLRLNIDGNADDYEARRMEKKRRENGADASRPSKPAKNPEKLPTVKRAASPVRIPSLLSPTLPPEVEAELDRIKGSSPPKQKKAKDRDDTIHIRKTVAERPSEPADGRGRDRFIVTIRIPKRCRAQARLLLRMNPRKEAQWSDPAPTTGGLGLGRVDKRPAKEVDHALQTGASKRPRPSEATKGPAPPSTPSKRASATAMSRVSSSNSTTRTPGGLAAAGTPLAPLSAERGPPSKATESRVQSLKERGEVLVKLGKSQKRLGDSALQSRADPSSQPDSGVTVGLVLMLESVAAFMASFHAQDTHRTLASKPCDPSIWQSLFPLIDMLQKETRRTDQRRSHHFLYSVSLLLQATSYGRLLSSWTTYDDPSDRVSVKHILRFERSRSRAWSQFRDANHDPTLRACATQWSTVDEVVESALCALGTWCADEGVDWSPHPRFKELGIRTS